MPYRFELDEPVSEGFRRIGDEQIKQAIKALSANDAATVATSIHESRKSMKRVRALLRLARIGLGDKTFRRENKRFREIAQTMSGARDAHVMLKTLAGLAPRDAGDEATAAAPKLADVLAARASAANGEAHAEQLAGIVSQLKAARRAFGKLDIGGGFDVLEEGLAKTYRDCRSSYADAYSIGSDASFHEWRKSVQQHWRQMRLVTHAWPEMMQARADLARQLSEMLGHDHDLAVLAAFAEEHAGKDFPKREAAHVAKLARTQQAALRAAARPLGERLLAQADRGLPRQIKRCWQAAVDAASTAAATTP
jgi:CHAD domain-containing protein